MEGHSIKLDRAEAILVIRAVEALMEDPDMVTEEGMEFLRRLRWWGECNFGLDF